MPQIILDFTIPRAPDASSSLQPRSLSGYILCYLGDHNIDGQPAYLFILRAGIRQVYYVVALSIEMESQLRSYEFLHIENVIPRPIQNFHHRFQEEDGFDIHNMEWYVHDPSEISYHGSILEARDEDGEIEQFKLIIEKEEY